MMIFGKTLFAQLIDQSLHIAWTLAILYPFILLDTPWWAWVGPSLWWIPREFVDQWHGWPIGGGKWLDISSYLVAVVMAILFARML